MTTKYLPFLLLISSLFLHSCGSETVFTKLPAEETNITFSNRITELDTMNVLTFEYVNNGGGVALGDFNNDKLVDVYFTGNQVDNKLYLNKGDFKFEDVSKKANVEAKEKWCSGVALVDINNDKLLDIYVSATVKKVASERANLLYVNQGVGKDGVPIFKEMAEEYGIADTTHTTNSVFFDYDNDGDLDLFVLVNEMDDNRFPNKYHDKIVDGSSKRTSRLYRNDSPPTPDGGASTRLLDSKAPPSGAGRPTLRGAGHPHFTNVSKEAGILIEGYGLGVNITDINRDGWKDIYVTNDYLTNDLLYINSGSKNGLSPRFTDEAGQYLKHTSYSAMGNEVEDLNNDGLMDILAVDMMPADNYRKKMMTPANNYLSYQNNEQYHYNYQYPRNTLQVNQGVNPKTGKPVFSEMGLLAGIAETDWSWTPMVTDFDNDGFRDIIITNGFPRDITDQDFMVYNSEVRSLMSPMMLLESIPSVKIANYAFKNTGNLQFENVTKDWGMETPSFSNGAAYADLDNDGDLDYVVNNINDSASVYRNNSIQLKPEESNYLRVKLNGLKNNINGIGAFIEIKYNKNEHQIYENTPYRGYLSTIENIAHFGLGKIKNIDEVKVIWQSGKIQILKDIPVNQVLIIDERLAVSPTSTVQQSNRRTVNNSTIIFKDISDSLSIDYVHKEVDAIDFNVQKLLPHKLSQFGPSLAVGDVNGDGLEDVYIGGSARYKGTFLLQNKAGKFTKSDLILGETDATKLAEDMGVLLFDADLDGDLDLYAVGGSYEFPKESPEHQDRFYENDGKGHFVQNKAALPQFLKTGSCVKATDFDHDGDLDLFIGGRVEAAAYPKPVSSYILRNDSPLTPRGGTKENSSVTPPLGAGGLGLHFTDITTQIAPNLKNIGLVCDALWTDFDNDGWMDLMLAGEWMPITILKNNQGKSFALSATESLKNKVGFWNSLTAGDFDNDGDMDYIAGNLGTNTLNRASDEYPVSIYAKDFNNDGNFDAIPTVFYQDATGNRKEVTFHGRDDLSKQMNTMRKKFNNYQKFAMAGIYDILTAEELKDALILKANYLKTSYIENLGDSKFKISVLPMQAQTAPVNGMLVEDFNDDGNLDVLMVGNDFGNEVSVGRLDAFNGLLLTGDGTGKFKSASLSESAFCVSGDAKGLVRVTNSQGKPVIMASQNRSDLKSFCGLKSLTTQPLKTNDAVVFEHLKNGKTRKMEIGYGTSFLSQSSRSVLLSSNIKSVEVVDFQGKRRAL